MKILTSQLLASSILVALSLPAQANVSDFVSTVKGYINGSSTENTEEAVNQPQPTQISNDELDRTSRILSSNPPVQSFNYRDAKRALYNKVKDSETLYTGCSIWPGHKPRPNLSSCHLENDFSGKRENRGSRIEAEHIIPASMMYFYGDKKTTRQCVKDAKKNRQNTRKYCVKNSEEYLKAYTDLVNLYPTVGQVNADRSNKPFGMVYNVKHTYTGSKSISGKKYFQPRPKVIGDIARVAFYMNWKYKIPFTKEEIETFVLWNQLDPINAEERERNLKIFQAQGWANPYIHSELLNQ